MTPLPPILPNANFKDISDEKPSSMSSGSLLGTGVLNLPDQDQNFVGLRSRASILKQKILELDRALLNLQPEVSFKFSSMLPCVPCVLPCVLNQLSDTQLFKNKSMAIIKFLLQLDMSSRAHLVRPLGNLPRLPLKPKAIYGYLTQAEPKYDVIYPHGINSKKSSIIEVGFERGDQGFVTTETIYLLEFELNIAPCCCSLALLYPRLF